MSPDKRAQVVCKYVLLFAFVGVLSACATRSNRIGGQPYIVDEIEKRFGERVAIKPDRPGCSVCISSAQEGHWKVCEVGGDYVRLCRIESSEYVIYPTAGVCISGQ